METEYRISFHSTHVLHKNRLGLLRTTVFPFVVLVFHPIALQKAQFIAVLERNGRTGGPSFVRRHDEDMRLFSAIFGAKF